MSFPKHDQDWRQDRRDELPPYVPVPIKPVPSPGDIASRLGRHSHKIRLAIAAGMLASFVGGVYFMEQNSAKVRHDRSVALEAECNRSSGFLPQPGVEEVAPGSVDIRQSTGRVVLRGENARIYVANGVHVEQVVICGTNAFIGTESTARVDVVGVFGIGAGAALFGESNKVAYKNSEGDNVIDVAQDSPYMLVGGELRKATEQ